MAASHTGKEMLTVGAGLEVHRQAPIFFLSYANSKYGQGSGSVFHDPNPSVLQLFDDLSVHVSEMVPYDRDPGFMDRSMKGGERWSQELLTAAGTCQVFLALLSQPYVSSEWCAMEWDAFSRRQTRRKGETGPASATTILPVIWTPPTRAMPKVVQAVQHFTPQHLPDHEIARKYHREGLYGVLQLPDHDAYKAITWRLAQRIVELLGQFDVDPLIPATHTELDPFFRNGDERHD